MQTHAQKHMAQYPARPTATPEILLKAAMEVEKDLAQWGNWADQCEGVGRALARISGGQHMNGYQLAKQLESDCALFDVDAEVVETLDSFGHEVDRLLTDLEKQWEHEHQVQPPHPIGTVLTDGPITGIYEHEAATYLVDHGRGRNCRLLIKYENAVTVAEHAVAQADKAQPVTLAC